MENNDNQIQNMQLDDDNNPVDKDDWQPGDDNENVFINEDAIACRYCRGPATPDDPMLQPCRCTGSIAFVHMSCLNQWIIDQKSLRCEVCQQNYAVDYPYELRQPDFIQFLPIIKETMFCCTVFLAVLCFFWLCFVFGCLFFVRLAFCAGIFDIITVFFMLLAHLILVVAGTSIAGWMVFDLMREFKEWQAVMSEVVVVDQLVGD